MFKNMDEMNGMVANEKILIKGGYIPITVKWTIEDNENVLKLYVDGVYWMTLDNPIHATVIMEMMKEHLTEYYEYEMLV